MLHFGHTICFRLQAREAKHILCLVLYEELTSIQRIKLALSQGHSSVCVSFQSPRLKTETGSVSETRFPLI
jgi:hypothetical protein